MVWRSGVETMARVNSRIQAEPIYAVVNIQINNADRQVILMEMKFYYIIENEYQHNNEYNFWRVSPHLAII